MTNQYLWSRITGPDPDLRAADADRERIAERLRQSHAEGRLDMAEFQERLEHCYEAKSLGELALLVRDMPRQDDTDQRSALAWLGTSSWARVGYTEPGLGRQIPSLRSSIACIS